MRLGIDADHAPLLELLHAGDEGLDESALRTEARDWGASRRTGELSRSYCFPYALVGWHSDRIGVDIERIVDCDEEFARSICTPQEAERAAGRDDEEIVSLWCSKEALAKALGDAVRYDPRRLQSPVAWHDGASGRWRARRLAAPDGYCAWVAWRSTFPFPS